MYCNDSLVRLASFLYMSMSGTMYEVSYMRPVVPDHDPHPLLAHHLKRLDISSRWQKRGVLDMRAA
jgi:hypothetical protein